MTMIRIITLCISLFLIVITEAQRKTKNDIPKRVYGSDQCPPDELPPVDQLNPMDDYGFPCIPKGRAGRATTYMGKVCVSWDYVVVGAGSAGSVVASRLSEEGNTVLVLEAGQAETLKTDIPAYASHLRGSSYNWDFRAEPQKGRYSAYTDGRLSYTKGRGIGGSSITNAMLYSRGSKAGWDSFAAAGNKGWAWADVFPYYLKAEKADLGLKCDYSKTHNQDGMLSIQYANYRTPLAEVFMKAADELCARTEDYNTGYPSGFSYAQTHTKDGHRDSSARAYLYPIIETRKSLDVFYESTATKINVAYNTAKSVDYVNNGETYTAYAKKEVIVTAGSIGSPKLLMLSGIGPARHLTSLGIPVIKDLKVGETMYDNPIFENLVFTVNTDKLTVGDFSKYEKEWFAQGTGPLTIANGVEALSFTKTKVSTDPRGVSDVAILLSSLGIFAETQKINNMDPDFFDSVYTNILGVPNFSLQPILLSPKSKGFLKLKDKCVASQPVISHDFYSNPQDLEAMLEAVKYAIGVTQTKSFQMYEAQVYEEPFPMCDAYKFGCDDYWRCALKAGTSTVSHPIGTCKMGNYSDPTAVVDPELRVRGVRSLRVCDSSVIPSPMGTHTNDATVVVAEKCADLIKSSYYY